MKKYKLIGLMLITTVGLAQAQSTSSKKNINTNKCTATYKNY